MSSTKIPTLATSADGISPRKYIGRRVTRSVARNMQEKTHNFGQIPSFHQSVLEMSESSKIPNPVLQPTGTPKRTYRPTGQLENALKTLEDCTDIANECEELANSFSMDNGAGDASICNSKKYENNQKQSKVRRICKWLWRIANFAFLCWVAVIVFHFYNPEVKSPFLSHKKWVQKMVEKGKTQLIVYFPDLQEILPEDVEGITTQSDNLPSVDESINDFEEETNVPENHIVDQVDFVDFVGSKFEEGKKWIDSSKISETVEESLSSLSNWWENIVNQLQ